MQLHWPDLYLQPINLWSAPWVGRRYEHVEPRQVTQSATTEESSPSEVAERILKLLGDR